MRSRELRCDPGSLRPSFNWAQCPSIPETIAVKTKVKTG